MTHLLSGQSVRLKGVGPATQVAREILESLGSTTDAPGGRPHVTIAGEAIERAGIPPGVVEVGTGFAAAALGIVASLNGRRALVDRADVAQWVLMPDRLAGVAGVQVPDPRPPLPVGDGAVCCEFGSADDASTFETLRRTCGAGMSNDPERLSAAAQDWGLAVAPYVAAGAAPTRPVIEFTTSVARNRTWRCFDDRPLTGVVVVDLTTMWAGPLATRLMAGLGAEVIRVEPAFRRDGLRRWGLRGDRDDRGAPSSPMFTTLCDGKRTVDLDLRASDDRAHFEALLARADVVVDSFTPRVMPNLGYGLDVLRRISSDVLIASVRAFPNGDRHRWRGYGSAAHAVSGLADDGDGSFSACAVSYPDPLAGLALLAAVIAQLAGRTRGLSSASEASLVGAVLPLHRLASWPSDEAMDVDGVGNRGAATRVPNTAALRLPNATHPMMSAAA